METSGNPVDKTVEEVGTLTLSEKGVKPGDPEETRLTGVESGIPGENQLTGMETIDPGEIHLTRGETGNAGKTQLTGVETRDPGRIHHTGVETGDAGETQLTVVETADAEETRLTGVETGNPGETQLTVVETADAGETQLTIVETADAEETQLTRVETADAEETKLTGVETADAQETELTVEETGDPEETQFTVVETVDAEETQLTVEETGDPEETQLTVEETGDPEDTQLTVEETAEAEETQLTGVETRDAKETHLTVVETADAEETQLTVVETADVGVTQPTGVVAGDLGGTPQGRDRNEEERKQISRAAGGENIQFQGESNAPSREDKNSEAVAREDKNSEAVDNLEQLPELRSNDINTMLQLAESRILLDESESVMDVARRIKDILLEEPRAEVRDLMLRAKKCEAAGNYPGQLILLWCACWLADRGQRERADVIKDCLDRMSPLGKNISVNVERRVGEYTPDVLVRLGTLLYLLNEDLEDEVEALENVDEDLLSKIRIRCLSNKASGLLQQHKMLKGIRLYRICIEMLRQRFKSNATKLVMMSEFLTVVGFVYLYYNKASAWKKMREARNAVLDACPVSDFDERCRDIILHALKTKLKFQTEERSASAPDETSESEPELSFLNETKEMFASAFRAFWCCFSDGDDLP